MSIKTLLMQLTASEDQQLTVALQDFFRGRVCTFHVSPKEQKIRDRIELLRQHIPDEVTDVFLEIDEAYGELMGEQNIEIYKRGFSDCLQLILSASDDHLKRGGEH